MADIENPSNLVYEGRRKILRYSHQAYNLRSSAFWPASPLPSLLEVVLLSVPKRITSETIELKFQPFIGLSIGTETTILNATLNSELLIIRGNLNQDPSPTRIVRGVVAWIDDQFCIHQTPPSYSGVDVYRGYQISFTVHGKTNFFISIFRD